MTRTVMTALIVGGIALGASAAFAAGQQSQSQQQTPKGWSYENPERPARAQGQPRHQPRRQLARRSKPGQLRDGEGKVGVGRV